MGIDFSKTKILLRVLCGKKGGSGATQIHSDVAGVLYIYLRGSGY
jgi:hypothetical protein